MAREFDGPLSKNDVAWLEARYPDSYVARMVEVHGTKGKSSKDEAEAEKARLEAEKARLEAEAAELLGSPNEGSDEDLIGAFDVVGSTEAEVKDWVKSASDEDKAAALAVEQAREDRAPRTGVVSLLS